MTLQPTWKTFWGEQHKGGEYVMPYCHDATGQGLRMVLGEHRVNGVVLVIVERMVAATMILESLPTRVDDDDGKEGISGLSTVFPC
jgi:hypothetical protein